MPALIDFSEGTHHITNSSSTRGGLIRVCSQKVEKPKNLGEDVLLPLAPEGTRPEGLLPLQRLVTLPVTPLNASGPGWCPQLGGALGPQQEPGEPGDANPGQGERSSAATASSVPSTLLGRLNAAVNRWLC